MLMECEIYHTINIRRTKLQRPPMPPDEARWTASHVQEVIEMYRLSFLANQSIDLVYHHNEKALDINDYSYLYGFNRDVIHYNITENLTR